MGSIFSGQKYTRLLHLQKHWGISTDDLFYAIENELLLACVWMPTRYMERGVIQDRHFIFSQFETEEGFVGIRPQDFHILASGGSARLRCFHSTTKRGTVLRLPHEPRQPTLLVQLQDLLVLAEDRAEFEAQYNLNPYTATGASEPSLADFNASDDYRHIRINGEEHHFGDVQAHVIEILYNASRSRKPWVHGKILLDGAGSTAVRLRDVFKSKRDWQKVILSDKSGSYRLNLPLHPMLEEKSAA